MTTQIPPMTQFIPQIPQLIQQIPQMNAGCPAPMPMGYQMPPTGYAPMPMGYLPPQTMTNGTSNVEMFSGFLKLCAAVFVIYIMYQIYLTLGNVFGELFEAVGQIAKPVSDVAKDAKPLLGDILGSDAFNALKGKGALTVARPLTQLLNKNTYTSGKGALSALKNVGKMFRFGF